MSNKPLRGTVIFRKVTLQEMDVMTKALKKYRQEQQTSRQETIKPQRT